MLRLRRDKTLQHSPKEKRLPSSALGSMAAKAQASEPDMLLVCFLIISMVLWLRDTPPKNACRAAGETEDNYYQPLEKAEIVRSGTDVTILCYSRMRYVVMQGVAAVEKDGYNPEVTDHLYRPDLAHTCPCTALYCPHLPLHPGYQPHPSHTPMIQDQ